MSEITYLDNCKNKAQYFRIGLVPSAGIEPAQFPIGVWDRRVYQFRQLGIFESSTLYVVTLNVQGGKPSVDIQRVTNLDIFLTLLKHVSRFGKISLSVVGNS